MISDHDEEGDEKGDEEDDDDDHDDGVYFMYLVSVYLCTLCILDLGHL